MLARTAWFGRARSSLKLTANPGDGVCPTPRGLVPAGHKPAGIFVNLARFADPLEIPVMNFAQQQADPRRRIVGFGAVLLFHLLIVYALVSGLAKKGVAVVRAPIETNAIEDI